MDQQQTPEPAPQAQEAPAEPPQQPQPAAEPPAPSTAPEPSHTPPGPSGSKLKVIGLIILFTIIGTVIGFFVFAGDDSQENNETPATADNSTQNETTDSQDQVASAQVLDKILYAHADSADQQQQLFTRPAAGGERAEIAGATLPDGINIAEIKQFDDLFVYSFSGGIGSMTTAGTATTLYSTSTGTALSDINSAGQVAHPVFTSTGGFTQSIDSINVIDVRTGAVVRSFSSTGEGSYDGDAYPEFWDNTNETLYYRNVILNSDAPTTALHKLQGGTNSTVFETTNNGSIIGRMAFAPDGSEVLWLESYLGLGSVNQDVANDPDRGAFKLQRTNLESGQTTLVAEFGKDLTNTNLFEQNPNPQIGWTQDGQPYYSYGTQVFQANSGGGESLIFESSTQVIGVYYVSDEAVIAGSRVSNGSASQFVSYLSFESGEAVRVMETTDNTTILGPTYR